MKANNTPVIDVNSLVTANHPPTGGRAPGIAPIKVLIDEIFLNGVYIHIYEKTVKKDNMDTIKLTLKNKYKIPTMDNKKPKINAFRGDI